MMIYNYKYVFRIKLYISIIFMLINMLIFYFIGFQFVPRNIVYNNYDISEFVSITPQQTNTGEDTFYRNFIFIEAVNDNTIISANYYMLTEDNEYNPNYVMFDREKKQYLETLDPYTLGISHNLAVAYGLYIGDTIMIRRLDQKYSYQVYYIFPEYYGDTEFDPYNKGLIILAYNDEIVSSYNTHQYIEYASGSGFYNNLSVNKNDFMRKIRIEMYALISIMILIIIADYVLIETLFVDSINKDIKVIKNYNYNNRQVNLYIIIQSLYKYGLIHLGLIMMLCILGFIASSIWFYFLYLIMGSIISFITIDYFRLRIKGLK